MKKNLVLGAVFAAALFAVSPAKAIDLPAAAVWVLWRGEASPVLFRRFWL